MNDPIQYRQARSKGVRPVVVQLGRLNAQQRAAMMADDVEPVDVQRPRTRQDCLPGGCNAERPCPFVACRNNLYIDAGISATSFQLNMPDIEPHEMTHSCALDIADAGGMTARDIAAIWRVSHQRIFQIEVSAMRKAARHLREIAADELAATTPDPKAVLCACGVSFVPRSTVQKRCGKGCPSISGTESEPCRQCGEVFVKAYRTERLCSDACREQRVKERMAHDARRRR